MDRGNILERAGFIIAGIFLFILSIQILASATSMLTPSLKEYFHFIKTPRKTLGFGWFGAYLMLSGSPIAALALSFFHSGLIGEVAAFYMVIGSRLGASIVLILLGVIENLRGRSDLADSLSIAFLSFLITFTINFPSLLLGRMLIQYSPIKFGLRLPFLVGITKLYDPIINVLLNHIGAIPSLPFSLILIWISLSTFERAFRQIKIREAKSSWINFMMERPQFSFILGSLITLAGQSVSLSIGIMVPLYLKGYIERRNLIPYIMGANIVTFVDTISAALLLQNPLAVNIATIALLSNLIMSLFFLAIYTRYYSFIERSMNFLLFHRGALIGFLIILFIFPGLLLFL